MALLSWLFIVTALYLALVGWDNMRVYFRIAPPPDTSRKKWPLVSVCVPARDEAHRIVPCLEGFLRQSYPNYEVLVTDDQSTDDTWKVLKRYAAKDRRIKPVKGKPMPKGWVGKSWACHQAVLKARGEWVLFTDADTWHEVDSLKRTVQTAEARSADLLSCMTGQATETWMEKLVIPVLCFNLISLFPIRWILRKGSPFAKVVWVNGQFLLFRRKALQAIGGHPTIKGRIDEDFSLARRMIAQGYKVDLFNGTDLVTCRMYSSAYDVWFGLSRNIFPSFDFSVPKALAGYLATMAITVLPFVLPFLTHPGSLLFGSSLALAIALVLLRLNQAVQFRFHLPSCFLHGLGSFIFLAIGFNSMRWYVVHGHGHWKGRLMVQKDLQAKSAYMA